MGVHIGATWQIHLNDCARREELSVPPNKFGQFCLCLENVAVTRQCIFVLRASLQAVQLVLCQSLEGSETANIRYIYVCDFCILWLDAYKLTIALVFNVKVAK